MGEFLGKYEIVRKLASGGMAEVFLAKQHGLAQFVRMVCLKRILSHLQTQEDFLQMFLDEARITANLVHPNIAQIYDLGQENTDYFIAMEYVHGHDLRRVYNQEVERGCAIAPEVAAHIMMQVALGLDYAHRQVGLDGKPLHLVHRDISPQNILITFEGFVKIIDFGVAKASGKIMETRSGVLKGKYSYMSPEQASGDLIDNRSDIFAMGITLYEVITGTRLFKRDNELETLHAVIACEITPPRSLNPNISEQLEEIILRALAFDPDERFATAGQMAQSLDRYLLARQIHYNSLSLARYMQELFALQLADEEFSGVLPGFTATQIDGQSEHKSLSAKSLISERFASQSWPKAEENLERTLSNVLGHEPYGDWAPLAESAHSQALPKRSRQTVVLRRSWRAWLSWSSLLGILIAALAVGLVVWRRQHPSMRYPAIATPTTTTPTPPPQPLPPNPAPASAPTPAADKPLGHLSISAPFATELHLNGEWLGETPLQHFAMLPGHYTIVASSPQLGWHEYYPVDITDHQETTLRIAPSRGRLIILAKPWAWASLGNQAAQRTPLYQTVYAGTYRVALQCPHQKSKHLKIHVRPDQRTVYTHFCKN